MWCITGADPDIEEGGAHIERVGTAMQCAQSAQFFLHVYNAQCSGRSGGMVPQENF